MEKNITLYRENGINKLYYANLHSGRYFTGLGLFGELHLC